MEMKKGLLVFVSIFLFICSAHAQGPASKAEKSQIPVSIETDSRFHADARRRFKCAINKTWLQYDVNDKAVSFYSPDEVYFVNFSRNPLRQMYNNVPQKDRKLTWKEYIDTMRNKKVFQQVARDISLRSSMAVARDAKVVSQEEALISGVPAFLMKIEGTMPEKNMKFQARDIMFLDGEDVFIIDARAQFSGAKSGAVEKELSSTVKQILNTFETIIKK